MQDKHKVTLYLPQELHRQLKVRSAVDLEPMSTIAERALVFYLEHPDVIDEVEEVYGQVHRIYSCPSCSASLVLHEGEMTPIHEQPGTLTDDESSVAGVQESCPEPNQQGEGELVPC
ncbi:MAG: hypothetical protein HC827_22610 [Cyanobacteria bacterium RM1_2_2]|nr:hypothetical protein [Cyanobacteria bacterium RM1_2_2]